MLFLKSLISFSKHMELFWQSILKGNGYHVVWNFLLNNLVFPDCLGNL